MTGDFFGASSLAPSVDLIFKALLAFSTVLLATVLVAVVYFCWKYRRGSKADRTPGRTRPSRLELAVAGVITALGLFTFIWAARVFRELYTPPADAIEIDVLAKQWMWIFHDARHGDQINRLRLPQGRAVRLVMTSEDVIHSLFIPAFRVKQDILPGRYTSLWFRAERVGTFELLCTQYCGLSHSQMRAVVEVVPSAEYDRLPASPSPVLAEGEHLYQTLACASCHEVSSPSRGGRLAPSLIGLYNRQVKLTDGRIVKADDNYLRRAILDPNAELVAGYEAAMPTFLGRLTESELLHLLDYLKSRTGGSP